MDHETQNPALPPSLVLQHGPLRIGVLHGHQVVPLGDTEALSAVARKMDVDVLISGGTHRYAVVIRDAFNACRLADLGVGLLVTASKRSSTIRGSLSTLDQQQARSHPSGVHQPPPPTLPQRKRTRRHRGPRKGIAPRALLPPQPTALKPPSRRRKTVLRRQQPSRTPHPSRPTRQRRFPLSPSSTFREPSS